MQELDKQIENASFDIGVRGYLPKQVDAFLDSLQANARAMRIEAEEMSAELDKYRAMEAELAELLIQARRDADRTNKMREAVLRLYRENERLRKTFTAYDEARGKRDLNNTDSARISVTEPGKLHGTEQEKCSAARPPKGCSASRIER